MEEYNNGKDLMPEDIFYEEFTTPENVKMYHAFLAFQPIKSHRLPDTGNIKYYVSTGHTKNQALQGLVKIMTKHLNRLIEGQKVEESLI